MSAAAEVQCRGQSPGRVRGTATCHLFYPAQSPRPLIATDLGHFGVSSFNRGISTTALSPAKPIPDPIPPASPSDIAASFWSKQFNFRTLTLSLTLTRALTFKRTLTVYRTPDPRHRHVPVAGLGVVAHGPIPSGQVPQCHTSQTSGTISP